MYTIGEFSKLSHISARMLRYYDAMGLLRPAYTGEENGYRYYDAAQLSVLYQIETLKGFGFALGDIPALLAQPPEELSQSIHKQRLATYGELNRLRATLRRMDEAVSNMEGNIVSDKYQVVVMEIPAQRVFSIRKEISIAETHALFQELYKEMGARGLRRSGASQLLYHGQEFSYEKMDAEAQVEVSGDHPDVKILPARLCAATTHVGPYESIRYAYDAICAWMEKHPAYQVCAPAIERYLKDEDMAQSPEELETGILFPVEKIAVEK